MKRQSYIIIYGINGRDAFQCWQSPIDIVVSNTATATEIMLKILDATIETHRSFRISREEIATKCLTKVNEVLL